MAMPGAVRTRSRRSAILRLVALAGFVALATVIVLLLPSLDVAQVRAWAADLGWLGAVAFVIVYGALTLTPVPKNLLAIASGIVWGFPLGAPLVYLGALLGAAAAFVIGRSLGREAVERLTGARMARLDDVLARRGFLAVLGVRLVPVVPFTLINYGAGLTAVRVRDYALGTAIGIIPGTAAYVALGAFGVEFGPVFWIALGVLGVLTVAGAIVGLRHRRRTTGDRRRVRTGEAAGADDVPAGQLRGRSGPGATSAG